MDGLTPAGSRAAATDEFRPAYLTLLDRGELDRRVTTAWAHLEDCDTYLNLMDQYSPCYRAWDYPPLDRPITHDEYERAVALADKHGLHRRDRLRRVRSSSG
jgi:uncharacterized Fe-S radical SAM superfamily protein PflX